MMALHEDMECNVCYLPFTRGERVPRVLHCDHTFCTGCLELIATPKDHLLTLSCPLCRRTSCVTVDKGVKGSLWVNTDLWEMISGSEEEQTEPNIEDSRENRPEAELSPKQERRSSKNSRLKFKLPTFLRKYNVMKVQQQQSLALSSNVEIISWRKLSSE